MAGAQSAHGWCTLYVTVGTVYAELVHSLLSLCTVMVMAGAQSSLRHYVTKLWFVHTLRH